MSFIILICFWLALLIQLIYHWGVFSKVSFFKNKSRKKNDDELEPVSVVVCARDAYEYLVDLLPSLLNQDYPDYEIVVVNDCSDDETEEYLKDIERRETKIKPVQLHQHLNFFNGKKFPLSMGIKSAKNDLLVFTDVNCTPADDQWLRSVVNCYKNNTEVVIGYSPYVRKKGLLNQLMRFDALQFALQYLSAALNKRPVLGIGKNLSYRKELFYRHKGFTSHYTTSAGDDDLFINHAARGKNTEALIDAEHGITTMPPQGFALWTRQKSSRYSTIPAYDGTSKAFLGLFTWSHLLFYATFIALICLKPAFCVAGKPVLYIPILVFFFLLRYVSQMVIYHGASKRLGEKGLLPGLLFYDLIFAILTPILRLMGRMKVGVE